jgi:hypothetical protein
VRLLSQLVDGMHACAGPEPSPADSAESIPASHAVALPAASWY